MLKTLLGGIGLALPIIATISGAALSQKITMEAASLPGNCPHCLEAIESTCSPGVSGLSCGIDSASTVP